MITKTAAGITATGLRKSYGDQVVLDGIDLNIAEGSVFALLGPNGAGKTTAVKILSTLTAAEAARKPAATYSGGMGFSARAGFAGWIAAIGLLALTSFALTWLGIAFGLAAKTLDAASNAPFPLILLPFVGSGIVPTRSMPTAVRYFAEYQPFTPIIETLRGLLMGTPIGSNGILAVAWCVGLTAVGFGWAMKAFARDRTR